MPHGTRGAPAILNMVERGPEREYVKPPTKIVWGSEILEVPPNEGVIPESLDGVQPDVACPVRGDRGLLPRAHQSPGRAPPR